MGLVKSNMALLFVLNFVGYIVLVIALYLPQLKRFQRIIRWALIVFTAITIIAYFAIVGLSDNTTGYVDKAAEIVLIVLLLLEDRKAARLARV
jgi:low affinity Fe/Cu permease